MNRTHTIAVRVTEEEWRDIEAMAKRNLDSASSWIRKIISEYVREHSND